MNTLPRNSILTGDATDVLASLPPASVDCVVTSPPYYQLRDYGAVGQLGLEASIQGWVDGLQAVSRQVARVLKPSGAFWLNLGDSFSRHPRYGAPPKGLLLGPGAAAAGAGRRRVAGAQQGDLGQDQPDALPDPRPAEPDVGGDVPAGALPQLLLRPGRDPGAAHAARSPEADDCRWPRSGLRLGGAAGRQPGRPGRGEGRGQAGSPAWARTRATSGGSATRGFRGAHFATFPPELVRRPILATCPAAGVQPLRAGLGTRCRARPGTGGPSCGFAATPRPGVVLDPFFGTGTVGLVARDLGRDWLGIELSPDYVQLARQRLGLATSRPGGGRMTACHPSPRRRSCSRCRHPTRGWPAAPAPRRTHVRTSGRGYKTLAVRLPDDLHAQLVLIAALEGCRSTTPSAGHRGPHRTKREDGDLAVQAAKALEEMEQEAATRRAALEALMGPAVPIQGGSDEGPARGPEPAHQLKHLAGGA